MFDCNIGLQHEATSFLQKANLILSSDKLWRKEQNAAAPENGLHRVPTCHNLNAKMILQNLRFGVAKLSEGDVFNWENQLNKR